MGVVTSVMELYDYDRSVIMACISNGPVPFDLRVVPKSKLRRRKPSVWIDTGGFYAYQARTSPGTVFVVPGETLYGDAAVVGPAKFDRRGKGDPVSDRF